MNAYKEFSRILEEGYRIIFPEMFKQHPELYESIADVMVLVRCLYTDEVDLMCELAYHKRPNEFVYLGRVLIARLRVHPDAGIPKGFELTSDEYHQDPDRYVVVESFVQVRFANNINKIVTMPRSVYRASAEPDNQIVGMTFWVLNREADYRY